MIRKHLASYKYAFRGIAIAFRNEVNMAINLVATMAVLIVNNVLQVSKTEWLITLILIGVVWMAEIFNTAVERLADRVTQNPDPMIGQVKDLSAGAVLVVCIFSVVCGIVIYYPYLF
jgi:diacylglycerol kinase